tara:strand:- start:466 stop:783 length:318 start_codon:yes stop_codon:yes gene_type:complete
MARSLTIKSVISQLEQMFGRQPENYMLTLVNEGLMDIAVTKQENVVSAKTNLEKKKRWYELPSNTIDIVKIEILDTNDRYVMIPRLADSHRILRDDTDESEDSLT